MPRHSPCVAESDPASSDAQRNLALSFNKLGDISLLEGDRQLAYQHYSQSLKLREALAAQQPENVTAQIDLGTSYVTLGNVSNSEEARSYYLQALKVRQGLAASAPAATSASRERDVWIVFNKLADLSLREHDLAAAGEYYDQALAQAKKLPALAPESVRAKTDLANSHVNVGNFNIRSGDVEAAKHSFGEAISLLRPLAEEDPRNIGLQTNFVLVLARHGDHVTAAQKANDLRNLAPQNHLNLYNVACCYSLCAAAVAGGKSADALTPSELAAQRGYQDQTIAALRQAAASGLKGAAGVTSDHDLDSIRSHPDYPKLLEDLKQAGP